MASHRSPTLPYSWWVVLLPLTGIAAFIWDGIYVGVTASKAMRNTMILSTVFIFLPAFYLFFPLLGKPWIVAGITTLYDKPRTQYVVTGP